MCCYRHSNLKKFLEDNFKEKKPSLEEILFLVDLVEARKKLKIQLASNYEIPEKAYPKTIEKKEMELHLRTIFKHQNKAIDLFFPGLSEAMEKTDREKAQSAVKMFYGDSENEK